MRYAGFWRRLNAYGVDAIIVQIATALVMFAYGALDAHAQTQEQINQLVLMGWLPPGSSVDTMPTIDLGLGSVAFVAGLVISAAYTIWFTAKWNGATPGKRLLKIQVVNENGSSISMAKSVGRFFASGISWLPLGVGYLMVGFTPQKTSLHDLMCRTRVIHREAANV